MGGFADDAGEGREKAGCEGERWEEASEAFDCDRDVMGTVRFCRFEDPGFAAL